MASAPTAELCSPNICLLWLRGWVWHGSRAGVITHLKCGGECPHLGKPTALCGPHQGESQGEYFPPPNLTSPWGCHDNQLWKPKAGIRGETAVRAGDWGYVLDSQSEMSLPPTFWPSHCMYFPASPSPPRLPPPRNSEYEFHLLSIQSSQFRETHKDCINFTSGFLTVCT